MKVRVEATIHLKLLALIDHARSGELGEPARADTETAAPAWEFAAHRIGGQELDV